MRFSAPGCNDVRRMPTGCIDGSTLTTRGKGLLGALTICENIHTRAPQPIRRRLFFGRISEDTSRPNERRTEERHFLRPVINRKLSLSKLSNRQGQRSGLTRDSPIYKFYLQGSLRVSINPTITD